jgi:hypothetical protein
MFKNRFRAPSLMEFIAGATTAWLVVVALLAAGWVMNIVALAGSNIDTIDAMLILRAVGVPLFPLGGVMGYL